MELKNPLKSARKMSQVEVNLEEMKMLEVKSSVMLQSAVTWILNSSKKRFQWFYKLIYPHSTLASVEEEMMANTIHEMAESLKVQVAENASLRTKIRNSRGNFIRQSAALKPV